MAGMEDKTLLSGKEPLSTEQLAGLVYSMGRTFDGLQATLRLQRNSFVQATPKPSVPGQITTSCSICSKLQSSLSSTTTPISLLILSY